MKKNPIVRAIENGRATKEEEFDAMVLLMDRHGEQDDPLKIKAKKPLVTIAETIDEAKEHMAAEGKIVGLTTGYRELDQMIQGLREGEIHVVFGDTGHGKSQLVQNITLNIASRDIPVLFIGTEMINRENTERFIELAGGNVDRVTRLPIIYPPDVPGYKKVDHLVAEAMENDCRLVVIDLLHNFESEGENEAAALSRMCREFKRVAVHHKVPVLLVSHINEDKLRKGVPELKDLKGSSSIKQIASSALAVWRDDELEPHQQTVLKVVCRKHRRGIKRRSVELAILPNARLESHTTTSFFPTAR